MPPPSSETLHGSMHSQKTTKQNKSLYIISPNGTKDAERSIPSKARENCKQLSEFCFDCNPHFIVKDPPVYLKAVVGVSPQDTPCVL